jgi:hypothetical protein
MERVSVLLGHSSIKVTEKHYSPSVRARQEQLEAGVRRRLAQTADFGLYWVPWTSNGLWNSSSRSRRN